jgi:hypothetical protein
MIHLTQFLIGFSGLTCVFYVFSKMFKAFGTLRNKAKYYLFNVIVFIICYVLHATAQELTPHELANLIIVVFMIVYLAWRARSS